MVSKIKR